MPAVRLRRMLAVVVVVVVVLAGAVVALPPVRHAVSGMLPRSLVVELNALRFGFHIDRDIRIVAPDGVHLAATLYLPREHEAHDVATVLVRLPYDRLDYGEVLNAGEYFARHGYAVLAVDLRGTGGSEGRLLPYAHAMDDGRATLDWIVAQPWSDGRVGTFGCSALGETQYVLARTQHPALRAMIPLGAGGAIGSAANRYSYFGLWEGGIFELASGFGWFEEHGAATQAVPAAGPFDLAAALRQLPVAGLVARYRPGPNGYDEFLRRPLDDPSWHDLGYLDDRDVPRVPVLDITTWGDQTVGDTLAFHASLPAKYAALGIPSPERHLVIAPGTHCHSQETGESGRFGELRVRGADQPYFEWYERWFDRLLRDRGPGLADLPPVLYYMLGEDRWLAAPSWPPPDSRVERWYFDSAGHANGARGDGALVRDPPRVEAADDYVDDPSRPVPSRGGPVCCTGDPAEVSGPHDQREIESRADVLVYTSPVLQAPLRIAGPLRAVLEVASSAPDADFVGRLVDVYPDGRAIALQEGAMRARYADGFDRPRPLVPGRPVRLTVDMRAVAATLAAGHRLRIDIASSSFPRLERNLHTAGDNEQATQLVPARNRVLHGGDRLSWIELPVLAPEPARAASAAARAGVARAHTS